MYGQSLSWWHQVLRALLFLGVLATPAFAKPAVENTARHIDRLLGQELFTAQTELAPLAGDAVYLRRVWLDIVGDIPPPEQVAAFLLDPSRDKRRRVVGELLADPQYGQNWARYWRDVILYRRLEDRAMIVANPLVFLLTDQFNNNVPWSKIASDFITATGDAQENGATAIVIAQDGRTEETTAEIARIFLGIQIQCSQCHDHPYDRWKREQFHELAAFFPRIAVRPVLTPTRRSFVVLSDDRREGPRRPEGEGRRGEAEHYMPDLNDPSLPGTRMKPRFFLTSSELPYGTRDVQRRTTLARWMTENPWFATSFVNRMWAELVGEGFYQPIDDMGPDRTPSAPKTVAFLSRAFTESGYDVKWLFQVICATEAYQRESRPRREPDGTPFTASIAQPLRSDQLFNALLTALEIDESADFRRGRPSSRNFPRGRNVDMRHTFQLVFGYDPSDPRETISRSMSQALAMMNGANLNLAIRAVSDNTVLGRLLDGIDDDEMVIHELYLRTLSREPTKNEMITALQYCRTGNNRNLAFEDLFWALLNSSEFSHRR